MRELNGMVYKFGTIATQATVSILALVILYLYLTIANRILTLLIGRQSSYYSVQGIAQLEAVVGIITSIFVLIVPSLLIIFLTWKIIKKIRFNQSAEHKFPPDQGEVPTEDLIAEEIVSTATNKALLIGKAWLKKGNASFALGRYQDAINAFNNSINLSPSYKAYFNRAVAYHKLGMKKQVINDLRAAAKLGHKKSQRILESKGIEYTKHTTQKDIG